MRRTIRWGILGTGRVARHFAEGLRQLEEAELTAVASRTPGRAREFAGRIGIPRAYDGYKQLAEDAGVDVVYIASPNDRHRDDCLLCLRAGKPVLCEKPFALNSEEAEEVVAAAREHRLFCMEAMWMRFLPLMRQVDATLGRIGDIRLLTAQLGHPHALDEKSRLFRLESGGGCLLDLGVYLVSLAFLVFKQAPVRVLAEGSLAPTGVDEQVAIILSYPGGGLATLAASLRGEATNDASVLGTCGRIHIRAPLYRPHRATLASFTEWTERSEARDGLMARIKQSPVIRSLYRRFDHLIGPLIHSGSEAIRVQFAGNGYHYEAAEVMRCLRSGRLESEVMPLEETIEILRTMDAIRSQLGITYPSESRVRSRD
jgi:predicted dehydrogenase